MSALNTDLYELTMAAGYFAAGKTEEVGTFELSIRRLPRQRNFLLTAGLEQAVKYLLNLSFSKEEIDYLRSLPQFRHATPAFFDFLADLRFTGDLFAMPEGTPAFAGEPILVVRAPIVQAQLAETYLLSTISFQTSIASKAARCLIAADGRKIVEFGSRRAHGPDAGILAGRAAYLAGCHGTSNAEAGRLFAIPVVGTAAHSWTMSFENERESFAALQRSLGDATVFLIDTYDTVEGAKLVASLGGPIYGVRLDSGDLLGLSKEVRRILDAAGLENAAIMATNDLDEDRIRELVLGGAPIDSFGIGTSLATSSDAPSLSAVYKLVELKQGTETRYVAKYSDEKITTPGAKQVYRCPGYDSLALSSECPGDVGGEPLLRPIISQGKLVERLPDLEASRETAMAAVAALPEALRTLQEAPSHRVELSAPLQKLAAEVRSQHQLIKL